jgi:sterol desaturase/sphingolipid hydroxylase (fatty acid hydroxylase superfamily)
MFQSDFVDYFSRVPWWVVPAIYVPMIAALFAYGVVAQHAGVLPAVGMAFVGFFVWTLAEYWLHRTLFHWVPDAPWGQRFHFLLHGVHHDWVNDKYRLVMPPAASLALAVVFFAMWRAILGPVWVFPFFAGHVFGYLCYDMCHYSVHHFRMKSKVLKRLKAHHMNHHHNKEGRKFGVSTTLWDHVFGTY